MLIYHVLRNGKPIGIIESNLGYALEYWKSRNTEDVKFTLQKEERVSLLWK